MNAMGQLSADYRLYLYTELVELVEDKIYMVQNSLDDKIYIKKILYLENFDIYTKLQELSVPNIPKVYDVIELEDRLIIIEEYINGLTLEEKLKEDGKLPKDIVIDYAISLANVLEVLHNCQPPIIHRDIKPSNIIISNDNVLKLIDFDVSRIHKDSASADTEILGTYGYAAPEQFGFSQSDPRTDIYSFGVTVNMLLTGELPKDGIYKGSLSNIISKCIKMDPNERFQTVGELREELLTYSDNREVTNKTTRSTKTSLPGLRSEKRSSKILGLLWYGLLVLIGLGFFIEELTLETRTDDFVIALLLFALTLFFGNYKNVKAKLPLLSSKSILLRIMGYIIYPLLLVILAGTFLST